MSCDPNIARVIESLETKFFRVRARVNSHSVGRGEMVKIIIHNPLTNADGTANNVEVLIGDASGQIYDLLPGANTPEIYAEDLKDLYLRVRPPGVTETDLVVLHYRERKPPKRKPKQ